MRRLLRAQVPPAALVPWVPDVPTVLFLAVLDGSGGEGGPRARPSKGFVETRYSRMKTVCLRKRNVFVRYFECFACGVQKPTSTHCASRIRLNDVFYMFDILHAIEQRPYFLSRTSPGTVSAFCLRCFHLKKTAGTAHVKNRYCLRAAPQRSLKLADWLDMHGLLERGLRNDDDESEVSALVELWEEALNDDE